jgi:hypothetical protein
MAKVHRPPYAGRAERIVLLVALVADEAAKLINALHIH